MAAPTMELRPIPAGVGVFAHRGPANLVRPLPSSKFSAVVNDYPFAADPPDAAAMAVSHYVIGRVYARLFSMDNTAAATGVQCGLCYLSVTELPSVELSLPSSFDVASCGLDEYPAATLADASMASCRHMPIWLTLRVPATRGRHTCFRRTLNTRRKCFFWLLAKAVFGADDHLVRLAQISFVPGIGRRNVASREGGGMQLRTRATPPP